MRAIQLQQTSAGPALIEADLPSPKAGPGELLIRVHAAGVTPTELLWYPTTHQQSGEARTGAVPGHELSGVVEALGAGVEGPPVGAAVFGMNDWFADGATAELCVTRPEWVAAKPAGLSHAEAASAPIGALTAWQGLYERAGLQAGESVLVHGGAGAVGIYAVQLARRRGARVVTTGSARNRYFLLELGADQVLDYHTERFDEVLQGLDVVFDVIGGETLERSWGVLKPQGRMVTIAAASEGTQDERTKQAFFIVEPKGDQLAEIAKLLDAGELRPIVQSVAAFADAPAAYLHPAKGRGKVVIDVAGAAEA